MAQAHASLVWMNHGSVGAAEAKGIRKDGANWRLARVVRDNVRVRSRHRRSEN